MAYRYMQIVDYFRSAIEQGTLSAGQKLPSIRLLKERFQCAVSVVQQAYTELQVQGLIRAVEKSGYFVCGIHAPDLPKVRNLRLPAKPFSPNTGDLVSRIMNLANQPEIIPLHGAIPHPAILPLATIKRHMLEVMRVNPQIIAQYTPAAGAISLRKELATLMLSKGVHVHPDQILITNGCSEALHLAIEACSSPGDTIAIESPAYFGMVSMLELMGRNVVAIPVKPDTGMDIDYLADILKQQSIKACMVTPNFQNPLGALMPDGNKRKLCDLAKRFDFFILEDDIYGDCYHASRASPPLKTFDIHNKVVYCTSFAKSLAPGLRLGFCIPGVLQAAMEKNKQRSTLGGPAILQESLAHFLASGGYQRHLLRFRKQIAQQVLAARDAVLRAFPAGTKCSQPQGGYFLWIQLPSGCNASTLFEDALKRKIGIIPGHAFGLRGTQYTDSIRLSCASPMDERMLQAIALLGKLCASSKASK